MCRASIFEARNNLSEYVKIAEGGEPVELTRYNKPVAVIISYSQYEPEKSNSSCFWLDEWRKEHYDELDNEGIPSYPKVYPDPNRVIFED